MRFIFGEIENVKSLEILNVNYGGFFPVKRPSVFPVNTVKAEERDWVGSNCRLLWVANWLLR